MIEIRNMTAETVPQVAAMEKLCFPDPWSEASVASELENPLSLWLLAMEGEKVLGYIGSQMVPPTADVLNLAVLPEYRKRGIGRTLVHALVEALGKQGVTSLSLEVRASNETAQNLYGNLGFSQVGRRPRYYLSPREDALILRKERVL